MLVSYHSRPLPMSHVSYDSNLGSEILILAGDIRSRSWLNIGGTYGINKTKWQHEIFGKTLHCINLANSSFIVNWGHTRRHNGATYYILIYLSKKEKKVLYISTSELLSLTLDQLLSCLTQA